MRTTKSAFDRLVGYLSRRDHTIRELRQKLSKYHEPSEIIAALEKADEIKILPDHKKMSLQLAQQLLRKGRGQRYISAYLKKKGLPLSLPDEDEELKRAKQIVFHTLRLEPPFTLAQKQKIFRYLSNRGFSSSLARSIMNIKKTD